MLEFVSYNSFGSVGGKRLEYDVNITKNTTKGAGNKIYTSTRIGLRNDCMDRIKDKYVGIAFDRDTKTLYLIPEKTLSAEQKKLIKLYKVGCTTTNSGNAVCSCCKNLLAFIEENNLWGFHDMTLDAKTGWFKIEPKQPIEFVERKGR